MRWRRWLVTLGIALTGFGVIRFLISFSPRPDTLGLHDGQLAPCPAMPNCCCSENFVNDHQTSPIAFSDASADAWARLKRVVAALPRTAIVTATDTYLHAECRTLLMGYIDDLEARLDADAGVIQIRSASRIGYSDLGVNAERIAAVRSAFKESSAVPR